MKNFFYILFFFALNTTIAQKKYVYISYDNKEVNREKFERIYKNGIHRDIALIQYIILKSENDSVITHRLQESLIIKELSPLEQENLLNYLNATTGKVLDRSKKIIINFYPILASCAPKSDRPVDTEFKKIISKRKDCNDLMFFVERGHLNNYINKNIYVDTNNYLKKMLKFEFECLSYIYIQPDGECYMLLGENHQRNILKYIEK